MRTLNITEHLESLDHGPIADFVGDARILELINTIAQRRGQDVSRGQLLLDAVGGGPGILENRNRRRLLFLTLSSDDAEQIRRVLDVDSLWDFRLTEARRDRLYAAFGLGLPEPIEEEHKFLVHPVRCDYGLFPHQTRALLEAWAVLRRPQGRVMLHMPTGAGKTRTAMHLISRHLSSRTQGLVVWLVSGTELCDQAADEFETAWGSLGERPLPLIRLWGGHRDVADGEFRKVNRESLRDLRFDEFHESRWPVELTDGVIVASLESMARLLDQWEPRQLGRRVQSVSLVVFDEAHRAIAPTYRRALEMLSVHSSLLGLSATPGRHHAGSDSLGDVSLANMFDHEKVTLQISGHASPVEGLIELGYLARLDKRELTIANSDLSGDELSRIQRRLSRNLDLDEGALAAFGLDATRNLQLVEEIEKLVFDEGHQRIIIFTATVFSAQLIANLLKAREIEAESVTNETPSPQRTQTLRRFREDDDTPRVICNYGVLTTGFDAPLTSAVVIARPTTSIVLLSQMAGRAIRGPRVGGTATATLVTVVDTAIPELVDTVRQFHAFDEAWEAGP